MSQSERPEDMENWQPFHKFMKTHFPHEKTLDLVNFLTILNGRIGQNEFVQGYGLRNIRVTHKPVFNMVLDN